MKEIKEGICVQHISCLEVILKPIIGQYLENSLFYYFKSC